MSSNEISIFLKKAEEYISLANEKEKKKEYHVARKYYLMASKAILEAAKKSPNDLKERRMEKVDKLVNKANCLGDKLVSKTDHVPLTIKEEEKGGKVIHLTEKPKITFKDVAGLDDVKEKIKDLILTPFLYPDVAKKWDVGTGGGVLLYGPSGTGKTLLAKAVAGEIDADFFNIKSNNIMSKWVGESEKKVVELFMRARESKKAVIFFDEIDALLPKRRGSMSTVMARVVPQFLAEMEGVDSKNDTLMFLAATNVPWDLDPAALGPHRFDFKVYIPLPGFEARKKIFELNLDVPREEPFDFDFLAQATDRYSGADISHICRETKRMMMKKDIQHEDDVLRNEHVIEIIAKIKPSVNEKMLQRFEKFDRII